MTDEPAPLSPSRPQWSDDGSRWWDGTAWFAKDLAPQRQQELAREQLSAEQAVEAERARQYAAWAAQQAQLVAAHPEAAFAPPGTTGAPPMPPPAPPAPAYAPTSETGYALGLWSFGLGLVGLSVPAIVLGHLSRSRSRRAGLKPFVWSRWGLFLGYVGLVISAGVVVLVVSVLAGGIDEATPVGQTLQVAGRVEQQYHDVYGTYGAAALAPSHFRPATGVTVTVVHADASSYCLRASDGVMTRFYASSTQQVSRTPC